MPRCDICGRKVKQTYRCKVCGARFCKKCGDVEREVCNDCLMYEQDIKTMESEFGEE